MSLTSSSSASHVTPYRLRTYVEPLDPFFNATRYRFEGLGANLSKTQQDDVKAVLGPLAWICGGKYPSGCVIEVWCDWHRTPEDNRKHLTVFLRECGSKYAAMHVYRVWDENKGRYVPTLDGASVDLLREERPKGILYRDTVFKAF